MASRLSLAFLIVAVLAARAFSACVPFGDADDLGCTPPDKVSLKCEQKFDQEALKLFRRIVDCHVMKAERPLVFDEEGCETTAKALFDKKVASFADKGCPACFTTDAPNLRDAVEGVLDASNGLAFCAGSTPFGGDDSGFVPPSNLDLACGRAVSQRISGYAHGVGKCHDRAAMEAFEAKTFDEEACEQALQSNFEGGLAAFFARHPHCDPCDASNAPALQGGIEAFLDQGVNELAYCAQ